MSWIGLPKQLLSYPRLRPCGIRASPARLSHARGWLLARSQVVFGHVYAGVREKSGDVAQRWRVAKSVINSLAHGLAQWIRFGCTARFCRLTARGNSLWGRHGHSLAVVKRPEFCAHQRFRQSITANRSHDPLRKNPQIATCPRADWRSPGLASLNRKLCNTEPLGQEYAPVCMRGTMLDHRKCPSKQRAFAHRVLEAASAATAPANHCGLAEAAANSQIRHNDVPDANALTTDFPPSPPCARFKNTIFDEAV